MAINPVPRATDTVEAADVPSVTCGACGRKRGGQMIGGAWRFGKCECQMTAADLASALHSTRIALEEAKVRADEHRAAYNIERQRADELAEQLANCRQSLDMAATEAQQLHDQLADADIVIQDLKAERYLNAEIGKLST